MARPRHAMRAHPLRSKGVVVGVPVAAAVAFGAHSVLGFTPVADQQTSTSAAPVAAAPVQGYEFAQAPSPTTLGLLSAPSTTQSAPTASSSSPAKRTVSQRITGAPSASVPITPAAATAAPTPAAPAPTMMTFSGGEQQAPAPASHDAAPRATQEAAPAPAPQQQDPGGGGGSLLGLDVGVAKVSVLSFGR